MSRKRFDPRDSFFQKAKKEGFRARSAYKLTEILCSHRVIRKGWIVLDLGAYPGGFLQVLAERVGSKGCVVGVDIQVIQDLGLDNVQTIVADVENDRSLTERLLEVHPQYHAVVSDMAPSTSGCTQRDAARSHRLVESAFDLAANVLRPGGVFVAKVFMGPGFEALTDSVRRRFADFRIVRPKATRASSKECFFVGVGLKMPVGSSNESLS